MRNHIIFFSGGKSSFTVAHLVKERYPEDNILLYFTDTLWEDEDLYRFIYEGSDKLQLPLLYHCYGLNPIQLMHKQRVVFNSLIGDCSKILKMGVAADFLKRGRNPDVVKWYNQHFLKSEINPLSDGFAENTTLYFGIGWEEAHREGPIKKNWSPFRVEMPLIEEVVDNAVVLERYNIRQPRLYDLGFAHNNCMTTGTLCQSRSRSLYQSFATVTGVVSKNDGIRASHEQIRSRISLFTQSKVHSRSGTI